MAKLTLQSILAKFNSIARLNANFSAIEAAIENTVSRDGTAPNAMGADLDMNNNKVTNLAEATNAAEATRLSQVQELIANAGLDWQGAWITATGYTAGDVVSNDGNSFICILAHTSASTNEPGVGVDTATYWDLLVSKGDAGVAGPAGTPGIAFDTINAQTGTSYTFVLGDADTTFVTLNNGAGITATVPPNSSVAYPIGTTLNFAQIGAGQVTVAQGSGVTVNVHASETLKLDGQYSVATLIKVNTNSWILTGRLENA